MNILFDFISLQDDYINGASEYTLVVLNQLLKNKNINLFGVYEKSKRINDDINEIIKNNNIQLIEITDKNINSFIDDNKISLFYITIAQRYARYDLSKITCKIMITFHDVGDLSQMYDNNINAKARYDFERKYVIKHTLKNDLKEIVQRKYHQFCKVDHIKKSYFNLSELVKQSNVYLITISEYSKYALLYFFNGIKNEIRVFSSPHKISELKEDIENEKLKSLVLEKKKYLLLLNCGRRNKNTALFIEQWNVLQRITKNKFTALLVGDVSLQMENVVVINKLSGSDLEQAYKNAFCLIYPSITEGYGYPPMEAMKYGTPTVCSNATSLPEVYADSVIYFNPYYPEDLFRAIIKMSNERELYSEKASHYYNVLNNKQQEDLQSLITYITQ